MPRRVTVPARAAPVALAALLAVPALPGCVERKLVIQSDPPGAQVSLEDEPVPGRTPVEVPTEWDGVRRVTLRKEGYRVLETTADVESRWFDWFPLDVVAQFLLPGTIHDIRIFAYRLEPYVPVDQQLTQEQRADLDERLALLKETAETYRTGGSAGPGGTAPPPLPEERRAEPATTPAPRIDRTPPPADVPVPYPVPAGVKPPPPVPPPPLFPPDERK